MKTPLLILDSSENYPFLKEFISAEKLETNYDLFWESDIDKISLLQDNLLEERGYLKESNMLPIFSFNISKLNTILNTVESVIPYFITLEKSEFKEAYEQFKELNLDLFVPKIKISSTKQIDILEVCSLFKGSNHRKLKYINGDATPLIIDFEGIKSLDYISTLKSGVLVSATDQDVEELDSSSHISSREKIIIQLEESGNLMKSFTYKVNANSDLGIVWTTINPYDSIYEIDKKIQIPSGLTCRFYLELEEHKDSLLINKVIQGTHPYVYSNDLK